MMTDYNEASASRLRTQKAALTYHIQTAHHYACRGVSEIR